MLTDDIAAFATRGLDTEEGALAWRGATSGADATLDSMSLPAVVKAAGRLFFTRISIPGFATT